MKNHIVHPVIFAILFYFLIGLTSCDLNSSPSLDTEENTTGEQAASEGENSQDEEGEDEIENTLEIEGEIAMAVLLASRAFPNVIQNENGSQEASLSLPPVKASIGAWNTPNTFPATPQAMWDDQAFRSNSGNSARYPASGYLDDFYGEEGNRAYMILRQTDDGWGDFKVNLYVLPTLSTSVKYTLEEYRVPANDWTYFVSEDDGLYDPIAFEGIESVYFDGLRESRELHWTRYVDGEVYDESNFSMPSDFNDSIYTYPQVVSEPSKVAAQDVGSVEEYSSYETFTVDHGRNNCSSQRSQYCITETGSEFYAILLNASQEVEKHSKSYSTRTMTYRNGLEIDANTVRIYHIDANGDKTVRSKTAQEYTLGNINYNTTTTEEIQITTLNNRGHYSSSTTNTQTTSFNNNNRTYTYTFSSQISLNETGEDTNVYSGILTIDFNGRSYSFSVQLDAVNGLQLAQKTVQPFLSAPNSKTPKLVTVESISVDFGDRDPLSEEEAQTSFQIVTSTGTYTGEIVGDVLSGTKSNEDGTQTTMIVGTGFAVFPEEE